MIRLAAIAALFFGTALARADDKAYADALKTAGNSVKVEKGGTLSAITFAKSEKLTDADFEKLGTLTGLTKLTFYGDCKMTDAQAAQVGKLGTLEELAINGTALSDDGFKEFARLKNLKGFTIWHLGWQNKSLTGSGFVALSECPKLERFNFSGSTVGDDGLKAVAQVKTLTEVVCYHTHITDAGLRHLKELPRLKSVNVGPQFSMRLGDAGLATLCEISTLERITYDETILTHAGSLKHLKALTGLKELTLNKTEVSAADLEKLKAELPGVTIKHTAPDEKMLDQMRKILDKKKQPLSESIMREVRRHPLTRRAFLRGAGAAMALPFLEQLAPAAGAVAKPPLRFGVFTVTGGTVLESWKPKEVGALNKLPSILRPLEFAKDELLVLSGLSHNGRTEGLNGHEHCAFLHLTGAEVAKKVDGKPVAAPSVDQVAARAVGDQTFLPSLEIGLSNHETQYSWRASDARVPYEANPRLVFDRMFRGRPPVVPNWKTRSAQAQTPVAHAPGSPRSAIDRSVLDLVREEAGDLRRDLGAADRKRLDQYLDGVRAIEKRIDFMEHRQRLEAADAANPGPSKLALPTNLPKENVPIWQVTNPVYRDPEYHESYTRLMVDLQVLAFQTDTTRVSVFACGSDEAQFPGVVTVGYETHCHTLEHQGNAGRVEDADPISREALRQIHVWYTQLFAGMVKRMKEIDEGGSTLLDNTLLLYTSYMADGGHGTQDYPVVLVGKAGGTLKPGRHVAYKPKTPVANLYAEILNRMGAKTEKFGENLTSPHRQYDGKLPDLV